MSAGIPRKRFYKTEKILFFRCGESIIKSISRPIIERNFGKMLHRKAKIFLGVSLLAMLCHSLWPLETPAAVFSKSQINKWMPVQPMLPAPDHEVVAAYKFILRLNPSLSVLRIAQWNPVNLSNATVDVGYIDQPQIEADQYLHVAYMKLDQNNQDTVQYKLFQNTQQLLQSYQLPLNPNNTDVKAIAMRLKGADVHIAVSAIDTATQQSMIYYFTKAPGSSSWQVMTFPITGQPEGLERKFCRY